MAQFETVVGGAYLTITEDSRLAYRVDPGGNTVQVNVLGPMELGIGMSPAMLRRCQDLLAEASRAVVVAQREAAEDCS